MRLHILGIRFKHDAMIQFLARKAETLGHFMPSSDTPGHVMGSRS
jgi:hypothetical protein